MTKPVTMVGMAAIFIYASPLAVRADEVPTYDVSKSCKTDVQAYQGTSGQASNTGCMTDEQSARATLVSEWTQYAPASRRECVGVQGDAAGPQSYVELLTCLRMARDAKGLPKD